MYTSARLSDKLLSRLSLTKTLCRSQNFLMPPFVNCLPILSLNCAYLAIPLYSICPISLPAQLYRLSISLFCSEQPFVVLAVGNVKCARGNWLEYSSLLGLLCISYLPHVQHCQERFDVQGCVCPATVAVEKGPGDEPVAAIGRGLPCAHSPILGALNRRVVPNSIWNNHTYLIC